MDESLFSALRIVAMIVGADGRADSEERQWFLKLLNGYGIPQQQIDLLTKDFPGITPIEEIHKNISNSGDRDRLLAWARFAANLDGKVHFRERDLLKKIEDLNERAGAFLVDDQTYGAVVRDQQRDIQLWQDLGAVGDFYNQPIYVRPWSYLRKYRPIKPVGLPPRARPVIYAFVIFMVFITLLIYCSALRKY